jgi:hypothetical protein
MPKVDEYIEVLMLSPDEACCPRPQCRSTDELLSRAYDTTARIGNPLSVLMLAQNRMLLPEHADLDLCNLNDASLQVFAFRNKEQGLVGGELQRWLSL